MNLNCPVCLTDKKDMSLRSRRFTCNLSSYIVDDRLTHYNSSTMFIPGLSSESCGWCFLLTWCHSSMRKLQWALHVTSASCRTMCNFSNRAVKWTCQASLVPRIRLNQWIWVSHWAPCHSESCEKNQLHITINGKDTSYACASSCHTHSHTAR
jgi:hypothetical protein